MSRVRNVSRNIFWGLLERFIALAVPFITRTVMIYTLGEMYSGLNGLFTSILQGLSVAELGMGSAITYSMYKPLAEGKTEEICALLNLNKKAFRIIGVIIFILGLSMVPFLRNLIAGEVPADINIYILYLMYLAGMVLSYELCSYRTALVVAVQRNDIISRVQAVIDVVQLCIQLIALCVVKSYYLFIICTIGCPIINNIIVAIASKKLYPMYICKGQVSYSVLSDIKQKVSGMLFQRIGGVVLSSVDTLVVSAFLGLRILAMYQNYYYIITSLFGILTILMNSMIATVGNSIVTESREKNLCDFKTFNFIYIWIITLCAACLICMYQPFMRVWMGEKLMLHDEIVLLLAVYFFVYKWCDMLFVYLEAYGAWWKTKFVPLIAAAVNLAVNLLLVQIIGLSGILISTIVSVLFVYDIGYANILFKEYFNSKNELWKYAGMQLLYMLTAAIAIGLSAFLCSYITLSSGGKLLISPVVCLVVQNVLYLLVFYRTDEFRNAKMLVKQVIVGGSNFVNKKRHPIMDLGTRQNTQMGMAMKRIIAYIIEKVNVVNRRIFFRRGKSIKKATARNGDGADIFEAYRKFVRENAAIKYSVEMRPISCREQSRYKWTGAQYYDNYLYGIPNSAAAFLRYHVLTKEVEYVAELGNEDFKWTGSCIWKHNLYAFPRRSKALLSYSFSNNTITLLESCMRYTGEHHYGGVCSEDGIVYQPPRNTDHILVWDLNKRTSKIIRLAANWRRLKLSYSTALIHTNGFIYFFPINGRIIKMSLDTEEWQFIGGRIKCGIFEAKIACDGNIYGFGAQNGILKVTVINDAVEMMHMDKYIGAYGAKLGINGKLYSIPGKGCYVWEYSPLENRLAVVWDTKDNSAAKYAGGVTLPNGDIVGIPEEEKKMLFLKTGSESTVIPDELYQRFWVDCY